MTAKKGISSSLGSMKFMQKALKKHSNTTSLKHSNTTSLAEERAPPARTSSNTLAAGEEWASKWVSKEFNEPSLVASDELSGNDSFLFLLGSCGDSPPPARISVRKSGILQKPLINETGNDQDNNETGNDQDNNETVNPFILGGNADTQDYEDDEIITMQPAADHKSHSSNSKADKKKTKKKNRVAKK